VEEVGSSAVGEMVVLKLVEKREALRAGDDKVVDFVALVGSGVLCTAENVRISPRP
jgi:hypothetical protein